MVDFVRWNALGGLGESFDGLIAGGKRRASGIYTLTVMPTEPAQGSARSRLQFTIVSPASLLPRLLPK
jgi:hypothetical protein